VSDRHTHVPYAFNSVSNWYRLVAGHMLVAPVLAVSAALALVDTDQCRCSKLCFVFAFADQSLFFYGTLGLLVVSTCECARARNNNVCVQSPHRV
jgi:hypothetical protein